MWVEPGGEPMDVPMEPSAKWFDQPHLGVFIGIDQSQSVTATWVTEGSELLLRRDVPLETAQGSAVSEIEERFWLEGGTMKATISRSGRPTDIHYELSRQ